VGAQPLGLLLRGLTSEDVLQLHRRHLCREYSLQGVLLKLPAAFVLDPRPPRLTACNRPEDAADMLTDRQVGN
jgi:hypothetical protein